MSRISETKPDAIPVDLDAQIAKDCPDCKATGLVEWAMGSYPCPECRRVRAIVAATEQRVRQEVLAEVKPGIDAVALDIQKLVAELNMRRVDFAGAMVAARAAGVSARTCSRRGMARGALHHRG